ncbi:MAG: outer membrane protein transport protein [Cocleimonas sp.]
MKVKKGLLAAAISISLVVITPTAQATNGMEPTGLGQIHKAMGGATVGNPQNTTTMMSNPAAASFVADGYDAGAEIFQPNRIATSSLPTGFGPGGTEYEGDAASAFLIPEAAYKRDKGRYSFGLAMWGNGGMNTSYKPDSPLFPTGAPAPNDFAPFNGGAPSTTGIDLKQLFIAPTISTKLNDNHSVGLSVNLVYQRFHATGIQAFQGDPRANPTDLQAFQDPGTDTSFGIGATIGWMGKLSDTFTMGASYRLKTDMSEFDKYSGLFEGGGDLDIPAALTIGASVKVTPKTTVAVDVKQIYYSDVGAIGNSASAGGLGADGGAGFGWEDQTIFKIGMKTQATPKLALMAGYNKGSSPVGPEDTFFGVLAPGVVEDHLSLGFEYSLSKKSSLIGHYRHAFSNTVNGDAMNPFNLEMDQNTIGLAYSKKF